MPMHGPITSVSTGVNGSTDQANHRNKMPDHTKPLANPARQYALEQMVMATNSSSIVSKRSVENLYHPDEPHYFRYFVKKYQRRAPLINRGYWLRLKAIDTIIRRFLTKHREAEKRLIVNLGCGSDVLPWQTYARYTDLCEDVLFVDIDYPELMRQKRSIVLETPQLRNILDKDFTVNDLDENHVMLRSKLYCQIGCDLRELDKIEQTLAELIPLSECSVLFVAEVSITYMDTLSADALIQRTSNIGNLAEFCLLEQILPHGADHPFARTMLNHFDKLGTPPKSIGQYPTLSKQFDRFTSRGFQDVNILDLWQVWSSEEFVSIAERISLDEKEPFDEWEDFALFGRHYFILHASTSPANTSQLLHRRHDPVGQLSQAQVSATTKCEGPKRRFGDTFAMRNPEGGRLAVNLFGLVPCGREGSCDLYSLDGQTDVPLLPIKGPIPRMCHTVTDLGDYGILLVGGRTSPSNALSDCWIFEKGLSINWKPTHTLPLPLFRHCTIRLRGSQLVLVAGGKTGPSKISDHFYVYHVSRGWLNCKKAGQIPPPTFGGILCNAPNAATHDGVFEGLIAGGIDQEGRIDQRVYHWRLELFDTEQPLIRFETCGEKVDPAKQLSLFGAKSVEFGPYTLICGGVGERQDSQGQNIVVIDTVSQDRYNVSELCRRSKAEALPFMIGSSVLRVDNSIVVFGGGATCFSMGSYWQGGASTISIHNKPVHWMESWPPPIMDSVRPQLLCSRKFIGSTQMSLQRNSIEVEASITNIARTRLETPQQFQDILEAAVPVVIEKADFGDCVQKWTTTYMIDRVGHDTQVIIHEGQRDSENMDFIAKNFCYTTQSFEDVIRRAEAGHRVYLRSLSRERPIDQPANINLDFPGLASDFHLPDQMKSIQDSLFSSVLRVSGRVNMWLHYDVMANIYAQVVGSKRLVLFPPSDIKKLAFAPGASSSSLDVFSELSSCRMNGTHPHEATLNPGDILYLPPLWLHAAKTIAGPSIAINVFFRNLNNGYAAGRDTYGNRDLAAYEKGRLDVERIGKRFQELPLATRRFYLIRLADELKLAAEGA
ncbi:hypothetical protein E4U57_003581 [Claviceps arundinis]|uniref:tRNA wybutosine-synthesizing protein 4 n=1 Tax=Claviceps arundinis TaxID=1623583 RepID=A0ABQ7P8G9_9HYPO|nr:hypothetical protein E4U57_003581 [Claviceps arundinis]